MKRICETDTSDGSDDETAAHRPMLRIKTLQSSCVKEETGANILIQHKQIKQEIAQLRYELQCHTRDMELKFERKLGEFVQMNTAAHAASRHEKANMQIIDVTDNNKQRQAHKNKVVVQSNNSQPQSENDGCVSSTHTAVSQRCMERDNESMKKDRDWEDSSFIDEGGWATNILTTRDKPPRRGRKKGKGKLHT